jgi:hypothetical protein
MHVRVPIPNLGHEPDAFLERNTASSGIESHERGSKCPFQQRMGNLALNTGPPESRAGIEAPHPQRIVQLRAGGFGVGGGGG